MGAANRLRAELEESIRIAENDYMRADYAESTAKMAAEKEDALRRIKHYEARLAELEADE